MRLLLFLNCLHLSFSPDLKHQPEVWHPNRPHHVHRVGQGPRRPRGDLQNGQESLRSRSNDFDCFRGKAMLR